MEGKYLVNVCVTEEKQLSVIGTSLFAGEEIKTAT